MDKEADEKADKVAMEYRGAGAGRKPVLRNTSLKYISSASIGSVAKVSKLDKSIHCLDLKSLAKNKTIFT